MPHRRAFMGAVAASTLPHALSQTAAAPLQAPATLGVAMLGTTHAHAAGKLEAVRRLNHLFELRGVVEPDPARRQTLGKQATYQNIEWLDLEQMLGDDSIDLVLVEPDIDQLLPAAQQCLDGGKHIHLDKPAGTHLPAWEHVLETAIKHRLQVQMGYMFRSNPAFEFALQAVRSGWLGEIFEIDAVMSKLVGAETRAELARYRGGSMFELGCHLIDMVVALLGMPSTISSFNRQTGDDSLYDNCLAVMTYPRATAVVRSSVVEVNGGRRRQFVICGTQGTIEIEPLEPPQLRLTLDRVREDRTGRKFRKGTQTVELPTRVGRYDRELEKLAAAIAGEVPLEFDYQHDLQVQECVLRCADMPLTS